MIVSLVYKVTRKLLSVPPVLLRRDTSKDAELLVLRHENAVLRQQLKGPVRYEPTDLVRDAVCADTPAALAHGLPGHPRHAPDLAPPAHRSPSACPPEGRSARHEHC
ncbi:hypothetical protein [Streptomyces brasiliensis]|uniref:Integrase n=1 Tax=Streptomyces brasiliensis TaxID=1954 RepID=A0A917UMA4_9ACTN|nr:hypothetical protein GCM10010121_093120 [Streptomyces brasiliensis]